MRPWRLTLLAMAAAASPWPEQADAQSASPIVEAAAVDISAHVREASQRFGIPERWIEAVIRVESAGRLRAISPAGAMGLMQLMPGTWARQRDRFALGPDPFDPRDNILAGTSYLREMYDRYGAPGFLAAYNAGPGRYEAWLARQRNLPLETRRYVAKVGHVLQRRTSPSSTAAVQRALPPTGGTRALPQASADPPEAERPERPGNPFASEAQPAHDLFAPVSTAFAR